MLLPPRDSLRICFAHTAYRMGDRFTLRATGINFVEVRGLDDLRQALPGCDVLVVSTLWRNDMARAGGRLKFIQSISAGVDWYDRDVLRTHGIRLASAAGVNAAAVAEHAMALILALRRQLHLARDNQNARHWRPMAADIAAREDELGGKTLLIVGMGRIGGRLAQLAKAFGMRVIGIKRDPARGTEPADATYGRERLHEVLAEADVVALTCPLTPETENLIDAKAIAAMRPSAHLINVARGRVVDEAALTAALRAGHIAAAGLDVTREEPLPAASPLWALPNVIITPHVGGETQRYEDGVIDILLDNLDRMWRGETVLRNQVV